MIPGGAHTYSKGDDQFPATAPRFLERGDGAHVWDDRDRRFLDWTMGLRTMTLGYRHAAVIEAAVEQIWKGSNFGRPSRIEMETAEDLLALLPSADMVKFGKNGSNVTTAAVKLARAHTGRDLVAICLDHPFFSFDDWFIGATPCHSGVPQAIRDLTVGFRYNDLDSVRRLFTEHPGRISAVIMEAATSEPPRDGFLHAVRSLCRDNGALFILDEMITGFRWHRGGAQAFYDLDPDLSTFGKGMGNGFAVSALVGKREIMELGGIGHKRRRVFLMSTTHGAENHALAAARAVMRVYGEQDVIGHMWRVGAALIEGLNEAARNSRVSDHFTAFGYACGPQFACRDRDGAISAPMRTLFLQEMARHGVIMNYVAPSLAHGPAEVDVTLEAARRALGVYARALEGDVGSLLEGPPLKPVFREYN
ncbi:glutamate-1-semialdehyde 2,1-aminomutase [Skermanella stibiiresistens SB22]|uniref:Glutamate-1-semialdehyde 2,1-aminomutase n=1 Tax=Skermanella stibiiresistens SB22 TaxID=1385369 RepID=W9HCS2_9PROT|nr:glutamate-1-semialdehyde 2,1-aminomutase [Skermanella stibiiresistens SB22]